MSVGTGDRRGQQVSDRQIGRHPGVPDDHVSRLAVLADDGHHEGPLGERGAREEGLVTAPVQHRPRVVAHAAIDRRIGTETG